jgi:hypothetical protein
VPLCLPLSDFGAATGNFPTMILGNHLWGDDVWGNHGGTAPTSFMISHAMWANEVNLGFVGKLYRGTSPRAPALWGPNSPTPPERGFADLAVDLAAPSIEPF